MAVSTKKRELNDMNAIACLLVILIHVLSMENIFSQVPAVGSMRTRKLSIELSEVSHIQA